MATFAYARPTTIAQAVATLDHYGPSARVLAGGTDLIIGLRDGTIAPEVVIDLKRIPDFRPSIREDDGRLIFSATAVMTDVTQHPTVQGRFAALAEAAHVVGSVQIRNRATLAGNICNASPAADTAPSLLVYGAVVVAAGPDGLRRIPIDAFFVRSGVTTLAPAELVVSVELPFPATSMGAVHVRRTRRRGHDLASVTLCAGVDETGVTRIAYGSVGPRPVLTIDETGVLADPASAREARTAVFDRMFAAASPSPRSMRAGPEYRLAMLRVLGSRAVETAIERLREERTNG
jgi:CO/xanthine dehydrogenase FAD-binding subunit